MSASAPQKTWLKLLIKIEFCTSKQIVPKLTIVIAMEKPEEKKTKILRPLKITKREDEKEE